jgi:hypothetical integral membrane protein (TIGR02206 family)
VNGLFAPERLIPLAAIAVVIPAVLLITRRRRGWARIGGRVLAVVTVVAEVSWWGSALITGTWTARYNLPLHLCEAGAFVLAGALWFSKPVLVEISYFWGLGGALEALVTPDMPFRFPHFVYFQYYVEHGAIVLGALYLVFTLGLRPRPGAVLRVFSITAAYAAFVGLADWATGGNYMYLRQIPPTGTLLDYLGPWPWYIGTCAIVALVVFTILYVPFIEWQASPRKTAAESV